MKIFKNKFSVKCTIEEMYGFFYGRISIGHLIIVGVVSLLLIPNVSFAVSRNFTTPGTTSFTVPAGVTSLNVQVVGAGGSGAGGTNEGTGGGGGGGGYSRQTLSVTPGQRYTVVVAPATPPGTDRGTPHCEPGADASGYAGSHSQFYGNGYNVVAWGGQGGRTQGSGGAGGSGSTVSGTSGTSMDRWNLNGGNGGRSGQNASYGVGSICSGYVEVGWAGSGCPSTAVPAGYGPSWGSGGGGVGMWGTCDWSAAYVYYAGAGAQGIVALDYTVDTGGTINVSSNVSSSWTITGPRTVTGSGTSGSYTAMPSGSYTIIWDDVEWYNKFPTGQSLTLSPGGTITFNGTYTEVVSGTWTAPSCPSSCGLSSSYQPYVCSGGEWIYNGRCRATQPADVWCPGTAACWVPTGWWVAPTCPAPTSCGQAAYSLPYSCVGGNGSCSGGTPTLSCPASAACPAPSAPACTGTAPTGASSCSTSEPTVNTPYTLLSSCSWSGVTKCHYACDSGYIVSGSSCVRTQCNNGIDDDGDGGIDFSGSTVDTGCTNINDNDESVPPELNVSRRTVPRGESMTLTWNLNGNTGCTLTGGNRTFDALLTTSSTTPIFARTTFRLTCDMGSDSEMVDTIPSSVES